MPAPYKNILILNNVSYKIDNTLINFKDINLSFAKEIYGIIGKNGIGKTTFLQLISGERDADSGLIQRSGSVIHVPQNHNSIAATASIAEALGVKPILQSMQRINTGNVQDSDHENMENQWDIQKRIEQALQHFNLWPLDINQAFQQLSGGQKTKILLAKTCILPADILLFDEPTNNLDTESRHILYDYIKHSNTAIIIVSHDRKLLNLCDKTIEINHQSIKLFGGNYDFYKKQKDNITQAQKHAIQSQSELLSKAKKTAQARKEKHQQHKSRGKFEKVKQIKAKGSYNKMELKPKKSQSEATNKRIQQQAERKLELIQQELTHARGQLEVNTKLDISLNNTRLPSNKNIITIKNLCFSYNIKVPLIQQFNFNLSGPNRLAIEGPNGSGKSTLIKLIRGKLSPDSGTLQIGVDSIAYLDQNVSCLEHHLSLVDNFLLKNSSAKQFDAYSALAAFKFRNTDAEKIVRTLSGGERMRAGLAISLMSTPAPQLIILDEPTNHLDIDTVLAIEAALNQYQGAILAVSHDKEFLKNIHINQSININNTAGDTH